MGLGHQVVEVGLVEQEPAVAEGVLGLAEALAHQFGTSVWTSADPWPGRWLPAHAGVTGRHQPPALCRVSAAVGSANRASRLALTGLVRPRRVSKSPTVASGGGQLA